MTILECIPSVELCSFFSPDTGGQIGRPRRQRASVEHDEDDLNRHGDFRGWNAKVQPRRATGQFKKSDEEDELSGDERGGGRGRNQQSRRRRSRSRSVESNSGRGGQGSAARFLPRTATGQLKPKGEPDELGQRRQRDYGKRLLTLVAVAVAEKI